MAALLFALGSGPLRAQSGNPTSALNPFYGSVTLAPATDETLRLSVNDAVRRGLESNLGLRQVENSERSVKALESQAVQNFLPTINLNGSTGIYQHNLAALGFNMDAIKEFTGGVIPPGLHTITRDDLTFGQIQYGQMLFSAPVISGLKAARSAKKAVYFGKMSARGEVVQQVLMAYLHVLAASGEVENAKALLAEDRLLLNHVEAAHLAGTAANLDVLRASVELQAQQQALLVAQNELDKDLILLKREIGVAPGQNLVLTDTLPYTQLAYQSLDQVRAIAYQSRQDYQSLQNQVIENKAVVTAYRAQRLPSLSIGGYYEVSKVNGVPSHGDFAVQGMLTMPLIREARLRGDVVAAQSNLTATNAQLADLRGRIDYQVRSAMLDVDATKQLVDVARSTVELATRAVADETERVDAGVDDNLPLVTAQATLASAQSYLVESLYQFNVSKLLLARAAGVLEQQYRDYLGN